MVVLSSFTLISKENITKVLHRFKIFFSPLRVVLLTPGVIKNHFIDHTYWFRRQKKDDQVVLILGGNAMSPVEAYDCVYARLIQDKRESLDCACIPLQKSFSQKDYIDLLVSRCRDDILVGKQSVYLYGHSLGGALALQLAVALSALDPKLKIHVFVSRSFDKLWNVSKFRYGNKVGGFFEKVFSSLWQLDSQQALRDLSQTQVAIILEQTSPDEVLGDALLFSQEANQREHFHYYYSKELKNIYPDLLHNVSQAHLISMKELGDLQQRTDVDTK